MSLFLWTISPTVAVYWCGDVIPHHALCVLYLVLMIDDDSDYCGIVLAADLIVWRCYLPLLYWCCIWYLLLYCAIDRLRDVWQPQSKNNLLITYCLCCIPAFVNSEGVVILQRVLYCGILLTKPTTPHHLCIIALLVCSIIPPTPPIATFLRIIIILLQRDDGGNDVW